MPYLAGYVTPQDYGAAGNGTADDTAAINSALAAVGAQGGGLVLLPWGAYLVSGTVSIPPFTYLVGQAAISLNLGATPPTTSRIIASASWAPSSATGIVSILSKTPGGWSANTASCGIRQVYLDGSPNASSNLNGVQLTGPAYDVHLEDVFIYRAPHNGVNASSQAESGITPTFPYHQRWDRVTAANSGNTGFNIVNFTDSTYGNCLAFANAGSGWSMQNNSNSQLNGCRSEWNTLYGYTVAGSSGGIAFTGCTTDQNTREGLYVNAATGQSGASGGGITWTGGKLHSDAAGAVSGHAYGIQVAGSTVPVIITGTNVEVGETASVSYPASAVGIGTSSSVIVSASMLQGGSAAWVDNGGNSFLERRGCLSLVGAPGSATLTQLSEIPAANVPLPEDQGLLQWTFDPASVVSAQIVPTAGQINLCRIQVRQTTTITNILLNLTASGSGLTSGENLVGLYSGAGALLSASADQTTNWGSGAPKLATSALAAPQTVAPGFYYIAVVANTSTTLPTFTRGTTTGSTGLNAGTTTSNPRFATFGTGQTTLPSSITITSAAASSLAWFAATS